MNKGLIGILAGIFLLVGLWYVLKKDEPEKEMVNTPANETSERVEEQESVKVELSGGNFKFSESEIKVKEGDMVEVTFINDEGMHDFVIDEFSARTKILKAGESETISFVADKKGSFEYYCSVGSHRAMGMKGTLIVE